MSKITTVICDTHVTSSVPEGIFLSLIKKYGYTEILDESHIDIESTLKLLSLSEILKFLLHSALIWKHVDARPSLAMASALMSQQMIEFEAWAKKGGLKSSQLDVDLIFGFTSVDPAASDEDKEKLEDRRNEVMAQNLHNSHITSSTGVLAKVGVFHCHPIRNLLKKIGVHMEEYRFVFSIPSVIELQRALQDIVDYALRSTNAVERFLNLPNLDVSLLLNLPRGNLYTALLNHRHNSLTHDELTNFGLKFAEKYNISVPGCDFSKTVTFDSVCLKNWITDGIPTAIQKLTVKPSEYQSGTVAFCPFDDQEAAKECSALLGLADDLRAENDL